MAGRYCALLAKDHTDLSRGEFLACLEAEGANYKVVYERGHLLCLEVDGNATAAARRSARLKLLIEEVIEDCLPAKPETLFLDPLLERLERMALRTFGVRVVKSDGNVNKQEWERVVGGRIKSAIPRLRVDLRSPDVWVMMITERERVHVGLLKYKPAARFVELAPGARPFLTSASMEPRLALTMVNLSRVARGGVVLDPFCGVGGILIEAARLGIHVVGGDISRKVVRGSVGNFKWAALPAIGFAVADVLHAPFVRADGIVCDPPYGRSAPLFGRTLEEIYEALYSLAASVLPRGKRLVTIIPHYAFVDLLPRTEELKLDEKYEVSVHGALTRVITVFRRV